MSSDYDTYDPDYVPPVFPLANPGAICWFNSLLQAMLSLSAFNKRMMENADNFHGNVFAKTYLRVLDDALNGRADPDASSKLLESMRVQADFMKIDLNLSTGQECADAGLVKFIELIGSPRVEALFHSVYEMRIHCTGCDRLTSSVRDKSVRIQMFAPVSSDEAFGAYLRAHKSEHDFYKCDCGHRMAKFQRVEVLKMLREVLVVVFNKFGSHDLQPVPAQLTFRGTAGGQLKYRLVAKIDHSGTRHSGHYRADVFRGGWYSANDGSISASDDRPTPGTFIAMYHMTT